MSCSLSVRWKPIFQHKKRIMNKVPRVANGNYFNRFTIIQRWCLFDAEKQQPQLPTRSLYIYIYCRKSLLCWKQLCSVVTPLHFFEMVVFGAHSQFPLGIFDYIWCLYACVCVQCAAFRPRWPEREREHQRYIVAITIMIKVNCGKMDIENNSQLLN